MSNCNPEINPHTVNAVPTKTFFIEMLVKDITLTSVICNLVDNCVDGAQQMKGGDDYRGIRVRIELTADSFSIVDNCSGISIDSDCHSHLYSFMFLKGS